jgi:hypothetical protein
MIGSKPQVRVLEFKWSDKTSYKLEIRYRTWWYTTDWETFDTYADKSLALSLAKLIEAGVMPKVNQVYPVE